MKQFVDIHTVLATPGDLEDLHDDPDQACEKLNLILHAVYDSLDEDESGDAVELFLNYVWQHWYKDKYLEHIEIEDILDWVIQLVDNTDIEELRQMMEN